MFVKCVAFLTFKLVLFQIGRGDGNYTNAQLFRQLNDIKKMLNQTNTQHLKASWNTKPCKSMKTIFDIRVDSIPKHCITDRIPSTCAEATECICSSGIYNIKNRANNKTLTVFCDIDNYGGDWLYILRRNDGTENFARSWKDYAKGFGNVAGEFWIGLENLYALTNLYGPQELFVFLESFNNRTTFARYDNFAIGNDTKHFELKSLGRYWGTAGDSLYRVLGKEFTTFDCDNDEMNKNCARIRGGGFWFKNCTDANPTANYLRGDYSGVYSRGSYWKTFEGSRHSLKTIIFMIRRQSVTNME